MIKLKYEYNVWINRDFYKINENYKNRICRIENFNKEIKKNLDDFNI